MAKIQLNMIELAWAAGFYDGEGCSCITKSSYYNKQGKQPRYRLVVTVSQKTNAFVLNRFNKAVQLGKIHGPDINFQYRWSVTTFEEVQAVICLLWKFLSPVKRKQYLRIIKEWRKIHEDLATTTT